MTSLRILAQSSRRQVIRLHRYFELTLTRSLSSVDENTETKKSKKKSDKSVGSSKMSAEQKSEIDNEKRIVESLQAFFEAAEKAKKASIPFTEEEKAEHLKIGREYSRQVRIRDNQEKKDLATKVWLQQEAMRALPADLRRHAEEIDETPPPRGRPWPIWWTPPIKGFNAQDYISRIEEEGEEGGEFDELPGNN